jgi:hypothetical protein
MVSFQEKREGDVRGGKSHVEIQVKLEAGYLQAKEHQGHQEPKKLRKRLGRASSSKPLKGTNTANTLILNFWTLNYGRIIFCLCKALLFQYFVTAATENS